MRLARLLAGIENIKENNEQLYDYLKSQARIEWEQ